MTRFTSALLRVASLACSEGDRARILEPLVADWQREYREVHGRGILYTGFVIVRGLLAFTTTLIICANPFRGTEGVPARRFALAALGFACAATIIQSAPFSAISLSRTTLRWDFFLSWPGYFAVGLWLSMLPAGILAGGRLRPARLATLLIVSLALAFVASDVVAPRTRRIQSERREFELWSRVLPPEQARKKVGQNDRAIAEMRRTDTTGAWTRNDYLERHRDAAFAVLTIAFGVLGTAIGRARASAGAAPRVAVAALWWFFVWMAYQLLGFWAGRLRVVLPAPAEVAIWIPPLVFLAIAMTASVRAKGGAEAPPLHS